MPEKAKKSISPTPVDASASAGDDQVNDNRSRSNQSKPVASKPEPGTYLCFDFGSKRIGIAVGHTDTSHASPLVTIRNVNGRPEWEKIDDLVNEWKPAGFVVGLPLRDDGEQQLQITLSASFSKKLSKRYTLTTHRCDERYSSIEASRILAENRKLGNRRKVEREDTDKIAAAVILDHWFTEIS